MLVSLRFFQARTVRKINRRYSAQNRKYIIQKQLKKSLRFFRPFLSDWCRTNNKLLDLRFYDNCHLATITFLQRRKVYVGHTAMFAKCNFIQGVHEFVSIKNNGMNSKLLEFVNNLLKPEPLWWNISTGFSFIPLSKTRNSATEKMKYLISELLQ